MSSLVSGLVAVTKRYAASFVLTLGLVWLVYKYHAVFTGLSFMKDATSTIAGNMSVIGIGVGLVVAGTLIWAYMESAALMFVAAACGLIGLVLTYAMLASKSSPPVDGSLYVIFGMLFGFEVFIALTKGIGALTESARQENTT